MQHCHRPHPPCPQVSQGTSALPQAGLSKDTVQRCLQPLMRHLTVPDGMHGLARQQSWCSATNPVLSPMTAMQSLWLQLSSVSGRSVRAVMLCRVTARCCRAQVLRGWLWDMPARLCTILHCHGRKKQGVH